VVSLSTLYNLPCDPTTPVLEPFPRSSLVLIVSSAACEFSYVLAVLDNTTGSYRSIGLVGLDCDPIFIFPADQLGNMDPIAMKLAYLSRCKLQIETRRREPRLCTLLGHVSIFESASASVAKTIDSFAAKPHSSYHAQDEAERSHDAGHIEYSGYAAGLPNTRPRPPLVVVNATEVTGEQHQDKDDQDDEYDDDDAVDDDDDDYCESDSTCEEWNEEDWSDSTADEDDLENPSGDIGGVIELPPCLKKCRLSEDDDRQLWAEQPKVLSYKQCQMLFLTTFT